MNENCTHTGLYGDSAYDILMLASALDSFKGSSQVTNAGYLIDAYFGKETRPTYDSTLYIQFFGDPYRCIRDVTRSEVDGEVILTNFAEADDPSKYSYDQVEWLNFSNEKRLDKLHCAISNMTYSLKRRYRCSDFDELKISIVGPCWCQPECYNGRWPADPDTLVKYPTRTKTFKVRLVEMYSLLNYFRTECDTVPMDSLKGIPWNSFKAVSYCEMRKEQKAAYNEAYDKIYNIGKEIVSDVPSMTYEELNKIMHDKLYEIEQVQSQYEYEWKQRAL